MPHGKNPRDKIRRHNAHKSNGAIPTLQVPFLHPVERGLQPHGPVQPKVITEQEEDDPQEPPRRRRKRHKSRSELREGGKRKKLDKDPKDLD